MLTRAGPSRRAASSKVPSLFSTPSRVASRSQLVRSVRPISLWPFRQHAPQDVQPLPVFFPKPRQPSFTRTWSSSMLRRLRYAIFCVLVYYFMWEIFFNVVLRPLIECLEEEWIALSEREKKEIQKAIEQDAAEGNMSGLFLAFPFTMKSEEQPFYKASDPEWKTFQEFAKDQNLQQQARKSLAMRLGTMVAKDPILSMHTGKDAKAVHWWLFINYPSRPPPERWVAGLLVDIGGLAWMERTMDPLEARIMEAVQYPKAAACAIWAFWKTFARCKFSDTAWALGLSSAKDPNRARPQLAVVYEPPATPDPPKQPYDLFRMPKPLRVDILIPRPVAGPLGNLGSTAKPASHERPRGNEVSKLLSPNMTEALLASLQAYKAQSRAVDPPCPRGCVRLSGMVEVRGQAGLVVLRVLAHYDPAAKNFAYVKPSVLTTAPWQNKPKGH